MDNIFDLIKVGNNDELQKHLTDNPSLANIKSEQGASPLQFAAYCANKEAIELIKRHKLTLDLFEAACVGDQEAIEAMLTSDPGLIDSFSADGFTALGLSCFFSHLLLVDFLLKKGANPNIASNNHLKVAPIHSATAISNYEMVENLLRHGADVNAQQMQGVTPLHSAAHNGKSMLTKLLIENGANVNAVMENGKTPLAMALEKDFHETAQLIIAHGGHSTNTKHLN